MQYILTTQEYDALTPVERLQMRNEALEVARKIIVKLANIPCGKAYCDSCPISHIGHYDDNDPDKISHESSRLICTKSRNYSK